MKIPRAESLIFVAFVGCLALWAIAKCSARRPDLVRKVRDIERDDVTEERPIRRDTVVVEKPRQTTPGPVTPPIEKQPTPTIPVPTQYSSTLKQPDAKADRPAITSEAAPKPSPANAKSNEPVAKSGTTLYVTIEGLKVRKEPGLKGEAVEQLALYAPVTFLNQKTEWTQEISLGYEKVTDHWVKIRTASGKVGWVFGAGVHFYKMKRSGVLKDVKPAEPATKKKN
jgi:hypothetical protein